MRVSYARMVSSSARGALRRRDVGDDALEDGVDVRQAGAAPGTGQAKAGRAVLDGRTLQCTTCRHHAFEAELSRDDNHCPLCHTVYPAQYRVA